MKVLLLSRYDRLGASSRLRSFQYISYLESKDWSVEVSPLFSNAYVQALYSGKPLYLEVIKSYWWRFRTLMTIRKYDLIWIEKELFPFMPAVAERILNKLGLAYVVDYDDALFHRYDQHRSFLVRALLGGKIDVVMRKSSLVLAGNNYLAERAQLAGAKNIEKVPTVIDLDRYPIIAKKKSPELIIGWIGSPSTSHYLTVLGSVFSILKQRFNIRIVAIGASDTTLKGSGIDVVPWSEYSEAALIQQFDIGIMPLDDSPWERGKCGYKLIQYMACNVPVVASPVGVNSKIVEHGENGFLAYNLIEWERCLSQLLSDESLRKLMGNKGRSVVESIYCVQKQAPKLEALMRDTVLG